MTLELTVPSKTFLLGEYVALKGGPVIILTSESRFTLVVNPSGEHTMKVAGIHPASPAGKLLQRYPECYRDFDLTFIDPYQGLGGFGASSAQFILLFSLKAKLPAIDEETLLAEYRQLAWQGEGMPPSGADLIAQLHGGICCFHQAEKNLQIFSWPFSDLAYCLIHTGNKLATHDHLKELKPFDETALSDIVFFGWESLQKADSHQFTDAIKNYARVLLELGLVALPTMTMLEHLNAHPDILAAKGCGALGADVILLIFTKKKHDSILAWLTEKKYHIIFSGQEVANGLETKEIG